MIIVCLGWHALVASLFGNCLFTEMEFALRHNVVSCTWIGEPAPCSPKSGSAVAVMLLRPAVGLQCALT